jgi:hypothetical protein
VAAQAGHEGPDGRLVAATSLRPLLDPLPPVLARRAGVPRDEMHMQVRYAIADDGGIDVLGPGGLAEGTARPHAPQADRTRLVVGQVCKARRVPPRLDKEPPRLDKEMSQAGGRPRASERLRGNDAGDQDQVVLRNRPARHGRTSVPVLAAHEAVRRTVTRRHG